MRRRHAATTIVTTYVEDLRNIVDLDAVRGAGLKLGVDPLGGASVGYWQRIAERYGLEPERGEPDGRSHVRVHEPWTGTARSAWIRRRRTRWPPGRSCGSDFDLALGQRRRRGPARHRHAGRRADEPEPLPGGGDRVPVRAPTRTGPPQAAIGKTLVSSSLIDRVAEDIGRPLVEVPVGFKWFVGGLLDGSLAFGGEESAGASFLRRDGGAWSTDKDGILLDLLAAEITARLGKDPGELYARADAHARRAGLPARRRAAPRPRRRTLLKRLSPQRRRDQRACGRADHAVLTQRAGQRRADRRAEGGRRATAGSRRGRRAPRTCTRSTRRALSGDEHLTRLIEEAQALVSNVFKARGA